MNATTVRTNLAAACAVLMLAFGAQAAELPIRYRQVEYATVTGVSSFSLGITLTEKHELQFKFSLYLPPNPMAWQNVFHSYVSEDHNATRIITHDKSLTDFYVNFLTKASGGGTIFANVVSEPGEVIEGYMNYNRARLNEVEQDLLHEKFGSANGGYIDFGWVTEGRAVSTIYYARVLELESGKMLREFIPCYDLVTGDVGVYESVSGQFLLWSGAAKGPDCGEFLQIEDIPATVYTEGGDGPHPEVRDTDGRLLVEGEDYTLSWATEEIGLAYVVATGRGAYKGVTGVRPFEQKYDATNWQKEFRKVEYLATTRSNGNGPYIKTGLVSNGRVPMVRIKYRISELIEDKYLFGYWNGAQAVQVGCYQNNTQVRLKFWSDAWYGGVLDTGVDHEILFNSPTGCYQDGELISASPAGLTDPETRCEYYLFGRNTEGNGWSEMLPCRIYSATFWMDGVKVRDFVPCYHEKFGTVGMFDTVEYKFYPKTAGNDFFKGADVVDFQIADMPEAVYVEDGEGPHPEVRDAQGQLLAEGEDYALSWSVKSIETGLVTVSGRGAYAGLHDEAKTFERRFDATNWQREFQEIKYLETTGAQYIKTGIVSNGRVPEVLIKYSIGEVVADGYLFGYWNGAQAVQVGCYQNNTQVRLKFRGDGWYGGVLDTGVVHRVLFNSPTGCYQDGRLISASPAGLSDPETEYEYYLLGRNTAGTGSLPLPCRVYSATFWMDGVKVRDFVPCYHKKFGTAGMFDKVEGRFYPNAGTGEFVMGPKIEGFVIGLF